MRELEEQGPLIDCREPPCALDGACRLSGVLAQAMQAFFDGLNAHTLADLVRDPTGAAIIRLHRAAEPSLSWPAAAAGQRLLAALFRARLAFTRDMIFCYGSARYWHLPPAGRRPE